MSLRSEIAEMFASLDGYERAELDLAAVGAWRLESLREHWRAMKRQQRQGGADRARDRAGYAKRYATDEAFRERRRAYWRAYDARRRQDPVFRARCAHRGCGACGPQHYRLTSAVEAFCRPPAYVLRHMGVHPSSLLDRELIAEATERAAAVAWLRGNGHDLAADEIERGAHWEAEP